MKTRLDAQDKRDSIVTVKAEQDKQNLVRRMYEDLYSTVYDKNDKSMRKTLRPIIDLKSLAIKVKENCFFDEVQFIKSSKQYVPDSDKRMQFQEARKKYSAF